MSGKDSCELYEAKGQPCEYTSQKKQIFIPRSHHVVGFSLQGRKVWRWDGPLVTDQTSQLWGFQARTVSQTQTPIAIYRLPPCTQPNR
jgi:hypothetical protein